MNYARIIDNGISIALFAFSMLLGFKLLRPKARKAKASPEETQRSSRRRLFVVLGVLTVAIGGRCLFSSSPTEGPEPLEATLRSWQEVNSTDRVFSVKMPGTPTLQTRDESGEAGPTKWVKQSVEAEDGQVIFSLNERHYLDETLEFDQAAVLDAHVKATATQAKARVLDEREIRHGNLIGKEVTLVPKLAPGYVVVTQFFLVGRTIYQLKVVSPAKERSPMVREFFDSVTVRELPGSR